jgi:hypothetical protein
VAGDRLALHGVAEAQRVPEAPWSSPRWSR